MIDIRNKKDCCGCTACYNACPQKCIELFEDEEGFIYPSVNLETCIRCGICEKVCPIANKKEEKLKSQKGFLFQNGNETVRKQSTSGGAFTAIGEYVIRNGGVVVGAMYDSYFNIVHGVVSEMDDLYRFRNSKYAQSDLGNIFKVVENKLKNGVLVCFSGTPCQIEGLLSFLRKEYENLICVDIVCHAVPSPKLWKKYLELQNNYVDRATNIVFRDKNPYGYKYASMSIYSDERIIYSRGVESDKMLRAFFSEISNRPSCYDCKFKKRYRLSDITIWDCFEVQKFSKEMDDDIGTTRVLVHSLKGNKVIEEISLNNKILEVSPDLLCDGVNEMFTSVKSNSKRSEFFYDMNVMKSEDLFHKYFPDSLSIKMKRMIRLFLIKTNLYKPLKAMRQKFK